AGSAAWPELGRWRNSVNRHLPGARTITRALDQSGRTASKPRVSAGGVLRRISLGRDPGGGPRCNARVLAPSVDNRSASISDTRDPGAYRGAGVRRTRPRHTGSTRPSEEARD